MAETVDAVIGTPRLRFDIEAFAATETVEGPNGPFVRKWRGSRSEGVKKADHSLKDASSGEGDTKHPAEFPRLLEPVVRARRQGGAA